MAAAYDKGRLSGQDEGETEAVNPSEISVTLRTAAASVGTQFVHVQWKS